MIFPICLEYSSLCCLYILKCLQRCAEVMVTKFLFCPMLYLFWRFSEKYIDFFLRKKSAENTIFQWLQTSLSLVSSLCVLYTTLPCPLVCFISHLSFHCNSQVLVSEVVFYFPPVCFSDTGFSTFSLPLSRSLFQLVSTPSGFCSIVVQLCASQPAVPFHPLQLSALSG